MKSVLVSVMLMGLVSTGLCIKCYVGVGDVGSDNVEEGTDFKSCQVSTAEAGGLKIATRAGVKTEVPNGCKDVTLLTAKSKVCHCNTDLCNSAPPTVHALIPIIAMALLVKFII